MRIKFYFTGDGEYTLTELAENGYGPEVLDDAVNVSVYPDASLGDTIEDAQATAVEWRTKLSQQQRQDDGKPLALESTPITLIKRSGSDVPFVARFALGSPRGSTKTQLNDEWESFFGS